MGYYATCDFVRNVVVLQWPNAVFAKFCCVHEPPVTERGLMVVEACHKLVLSKAYVRLAFPVVVACDGGLIDYWWFQTWSVHRALCLTSAVTGFCLSSGSSRGWLEMFLVLIVDVEIWLTFIHKHSTYSSSTQHGAVFMWSNSTWYQTDID